MTVMLGEVSASDAVARLLSPEAVRERAHELLARGLDGKLAHWWINLSRLPSVADYVVAVTRAAYPALQVPFHSRWRHFAAGGRDRWAGLVRGAPWKDAAARARAAFDLAIASVLLDAGAGMAWRYVEAATGEVFSKSEGLAVASFDMFVAGRFSSSQWDSLRADANGLRAVSAATLAVGFQVKPDNPLVGVEGRAALMRRLGDVVAARPDVFGREGDPRPGGLFDVLRGEAMNGVLPARRILIALLQHLGAIWPGRETLQGTNLGDCWRHPGIVRQDATNGLIPFHKLSQWLAYSLIEPLEDAGLRVVDIDALTGLPEYRNGGLFFDTGTITLIDPDAITRVHQAGDPLVVEWRALTVALLDRLAPLVRDRLGLSAETFPLAKVLEGGSWAAGRRLARERRQDGGPPLSIESDGTVF